MLVQDHLKNGVINGKNQRSKTWQQNNQAAKN